MKPLESLTAEDAELIVGYMEHYGGCGAYPLDCVPISTDIFLRYWNTHKENLFHFMGDKLIVEKEVDIEYPGVLLWAEIETKIFHARLPFVTEYFDLCSRIYDKDYNLYNCMTKLMTVETLCNNIYNDDNVLVPVPNDGRPIALNKGCKAMKVLAKIANAYNLNGFEEFRLRHSMILNHKRFKGTLCVSIHPLDYMTMSDNDYNWDSCMSWQKPGEYRQGTIESMNTENVVVAYLKGDEDMNLWTDGPKWSNKRWRQLFYVCPDLVTDIRGYPYDDVVLRGEVFKMLREIMEANAPSWAWGTEAFTVRAGGRVNRIHDATMRLYVDNHIMYNDYSGEHTMYIGPSLLEYLFYHSEYTLYFSGETMCLHCGEDWTERWNRFNTEYLLCPDCTGEYICDSCGESICESDIVYFADTDDEIICHYCAERMGESCYSCGDWYHDYNIKHVFLRHMGEIDDDISIGLCRHCVEGNALEDEIGPISYEPRNGWTIGKRYIVNSANLNGVGFNLFGYYGKSMEEMMAQAKEYEASQTEID